MAILIDEKTKVLVQGITGRTGEFGTRLMIEYGTKVVAGVTPGRGGEYVWGVPVHNTVEEAVREHGSIDMSAVFVPAPQVKNAVLEALNANIKTLVIPAERVPLHDILEILAVAKRRNAMIIGPGSMGVISPGKAVCGWLGGARELADIAFRPGRIGVISRSGGMTTTVSWMISKSGLGISTAVHVGTEVLVGMNVVDYLRLFEKDPETDATVVFGEIGGAMEIEVAEAIKRGEIKKPVVVYIAGRGLPSGMRFSHASAIIEGRRDSVDYKLKMLREAGAYTAETFGELVPMLVKVPKR